MTGVVARSSDIGVVGAGSSIGTKLLQQHRLNPVSFTGWCSIVVHSRYDGVFIRTKDKG